MLPFPVGGGAPVKRAILGVLAVAVGVAAALLIPEPSFKITHRGIYYQGSPYFPCDQWFATHYDEAVAPSSLDNLKAINPKFKGYTYKSATDDYLTLNDGVTLHPMGALVVSIAESLGIPFENCYLHYADTTIVAVWDNTGQHTQTYLPGARVEVYQGGHQNAGYRYACAFVNGGQDVHLEQWLRTAAVKSRGGRTFDGMFLDNCGNILYNFGDPVTKGGTVAEAGVKIGTPAFNQWHWASISATLRRYRAAMNDRGQLVAINVANSWTDDFATGAVANRLVQEFVGNPIRDTWPSVWEVIRRHQLAGANKVGVWESAGPMLGTPAVTWDQMSYGTLCQYLVVADRNGYSSYHVQDWTGPNRPDWPQRVISRADSICVRLGKPTDDGATWMKGKTARGTVYEVICRMYEHGAVYVRQLAPWSGKTDDVVKFARPWQMVYIDPSGAFAKPDSIVVLNGGGAILLLP